MSLMLLTVLHHRVQSTRFCVLNGELPSFLMFLKDMNSISEECNDLKKRYDACFNSWYTESFLRGDTKSEPCRELFESYRACVMKALRDKNISIEEVEKDVLGTNKEKKAPDGSVPEI